MALTQDIIDERIESGTPVTDDEVSELLGLYAQYPNEYFPIVQYLDQQSVNLGPTTTGVELSEIIGDVITAEDTALELEQALADEIASYEAAAATLAEAIEEGAQPPPGAAMLGIEHQKKVDRITAQINQLRADAAEDAQKAISDEAAREAAQELAEEEPDKVRLAQQCMLTAIMHPLSEMNSLMGYGNDKMIHLTGDPDLLVSQLTKRPGEIEFNKICPEVLAELVPYVRIYKVLRKSADGPVERTIELKFDTGITVSSTHLRANETREDLV